MLDMNVSKNSDNTVVTVKGDLTVNNSRALYEKIVSLFDETDSLEIDVSKAENVDMTFLQLICCCHREFVKANKDFRISGVKDKIYSKSDNLGYTRHKGCGFDIKNNCVLVKEV
jgi:ABC-type transporter Mla MlaB component